MVVDRGKASIYASTNSILPWLKVATESYWIDATCIPSDPQLRKEAIKTINTVFTISKVVLIIDKDIQSVDLSTPCIETLETLLSTDLA